MDIYFALAYPVQQVDHKFSVQASENMIVHEDKVILGAFIGSLIIALLVFLISVRENRRKKSMMPAGLAACSMALIIMNGLFLLDNQLRI